MIVTENKLPRNWEMKPLTEVCLKITDGSHYSPKSKSEGYPYVTVRDIKKDDKINFEECLKISEDDFNALQKNDCKPILNDVLFSKDGTVGKVCLVNFDLDFVVLSSIAILRPNYKILNSKFLFHVLKSTSFLNKALDQKKGVAIRRIILRDLKEIKIPIPPIVQQHEIVSKIEELFSELDKGIENLKLAQQQLKVYRQSVLKWAFEGRLTNEAVKQGELPEGWRIVKLGDVSKLSGGLTKNPKRNEMNLKLPFLRVANVYFNFLDLEEMHTIGIGENELERVKLETNDLLFVEGNGSLEQIGRVALWNGAIKDCVHQNHLIKSRLSKQVIPKFALYFFCSKAGRENIKLQANSTSGLHTLSLGKISKLEIPLSSIQEQYKIVEEIESRLSVSDKMEESINQSLQQSEALRQSILKRAFEGILLK